MAEELVEIMKKRSEKSLEDKLVDLASILDKAIRYYNFKIKELEDKIKMNELRFSLKKKILENKKRVELSPKSSPETKVKSYAVGLRETIMGELNEMLEKRK